MARDLTNIRFTRVALVDKGANYDKETGDGAHILLWKRDNSMQHEDPKTCKCADCMAKRQKKEKRMKLGEFLKSVVGIAAEPDAAKRATAAAGLENVELELTEAPVIKAEEAVIKAHVEKATTDLAKKNEDLEKRLKASEDAQTATTNLLKAERVERLNKEMTVLLKSFKATSFNVDEADQKNDIQKFCKMQETDPEGFARIIELFKAADAQMAQNALFAKNLGSNQGGTAGSAEAQLMAKADAIIQKDGKLSKAAAFEQACFDNPALVKQYRAEQQ